MKKFKIFPLLLITIILLGACAPALPESIKIGVNAPLTGDIPKVGEGTKLCRRIVVGRNRGHNHRRWQMITRWNSSSETMSPKASPLRL
jgi:hypothetical protein